MGPFEGVGSISAGTAHIINMGQIDTIGRISLDFEVGPLVVPVHFYSMGPCGLFRLQRSNCMWVLPTTTTKCLPWAPTFAVFFKFYTFEKMSKNQLLAKKEVTLALMVLFGLFHLPKLIQACMSLD